MSFASSEVVLINYLKSILSQINFYFGMFIFSFGIVGNILNILILSQRSLRSNPCVIIFLASSFTGIVAILSGLTSRVLSGVSTDLSATVNWICKFRGFVLFTSRAATFWLITLATMDRWLLSSADVRRRQMSTKKNALRGILTIILGSSIIHLQLFYCYEANLIGTPLKCFTRNVECRLINDLAFAIIAILFPLILNVIFGWTMISNIRKARSRIQQMTITTVISPKRLNVQQRRSRKIDQRLLLMLFVQVIFLALFTLPLAIQKLYATLTINMMKSSLEVVVEDFIYQIALICTYFAAGMSFYINTLSGGSVFRKAMFNAKELVLRKVLCE